MDNRLTLAFASAVQLIPLAILDAGMRLWLWCSEGWWLVDGDGYSGLVSERAWVEGRWRYLGWREMLWKRR